MVTGITSGSFKKQPKIVAFVSQQKVNEDGVLSEKFYPLSTKNVFLTQTDKTGKPKSGLSRTMTEEEAAISSEVSSPKRQTYIDLIDSGLSAEDAAYLAKSAPKYCEYQNLISENEKGKPLSGASRVLTQEEAVFFVKEGGHALTPSKLQDFIDLSDEGISLTDCRNLLLRKSVLDRYYTLTRNDEEGNPKSKASRVLTRDEALTVIKGNLPTRNVQNFIDVVDAGAPSDVAVLMAQNTASVKNFLSYILTDTFGNPLSGLRRSMTVEEAIYATTKHKGNKERLLYEIDNGLFKIPSKLDIKG